MGLFLFMKNAGTKVFGVENTYLKVSSETVTTKINLESSLAKKLEEKITELQLHVENLNIFIDRDVAIISGLAYNQATREKVVLVVGNSNGIASVEDYMTVENIEPVAQFYAVMCGDTLEKIAELFYGNAANYSVIFEANRPMLKHPNKIYSGQVLRIPA